MPLTETEKRTYLIISLIFEKIMDDSNSYEMGFYSWSQTKPQILQTMLLDDDRWEEISNTGDEDEELQERLQLLREKYDSTTKQELIENPYIVTFA